MIYSTRRKAVSRPNVFTAPIMGIRHPPKFHQCLQAHRHQFLSLGNSREGLPQGCPRTTTAPQWTPWQVTQYFRRCRSLLLPHRCHPTSIRMITPLFHISSGWAPPTYYHQPNALQESVSAARRREPAENVLVHTLFNL